MSIIPSLRTAACVSATLAGAVGLSAAEPVEADSVWEALKGGTASLNARYRIEGVDVDGSDKDALASTLRVRLGYETASYLGFTGFLEFEGTAPIGNHKYNDPVEPHPSRPTVLDPENYEMNRYWLKYANEACDATGKLGRQRIIHDGARFVGNVGWRQNEQTFDALQATYDGVENLKLEYDYVYGVQRIIGEGGADSESGLPSTSNDYMHSHFLHANYAFEGIGSLSGFGYLLDYAHKQALDTSTVGLDFGGAYKLNDEWSVVYKAVIATQSDAFDNELDHSQAYYNLEAGATWTSITVKLGYEVLEGDGETNFATPLATAHKFNGWADVLLPLSTVSLPDGLEDLYLTVGGAIPQVEGLKAAVFYHLFSGVESGDDYGTELDAVVTYKAKDLDGMVFGAKFAAFSADDDSALVDVTKFWLWTEYSF